MTGLGHIRTEHHTRLGQHGFLVRCCGRHGGSGMSGEKIVLGRDVQVSAEEDRDLVTIKAPSPWPMSTNTTSSSRSSPKSLAFILPAWRAP